MNRREFIKQGSVLSAAAGISSFTSQTKAVAANDRVGVGLIGCGGMGRMNLTDFMKNPEVEAVAVCDVFQGNLEKALAVTQGNAKTYHDFRKVLENKDIDAVIIATPDHWHPLIMISACEAGKDVYVEKPVSNRIREGRLMVEAARRTNRVVQVGLQQRSGTHFQRAVKMIQEGQIGKVYYAQCWNHEFSKQEGMGNPPDSDPPAGLDWDFWLGPAPKVPFNKNRFGGTFRWFFDYGGGKLADWGTHLIDIVHWAMKVDAPLSATSSGGKLYLTDNRETPDTQSVIYEYPGFLLQYSILNHNTYGHNGNWGAKPFGSYGILFHGTLGTLFIDRAGYEVTSQPEMNSDPTGTSVRDIDDLTGTSLYYTTKLTPSRGTTSVQHLPHVQNFLACMKTRQRPNADIEVGHQTTTACHLGNISLRVGQKIRWDAKTEQIIDNMKANEMVTKQYRAPWNLPGM